MLTVFCRELAFLLVPGLVKEAAATVETVEVAVAGEVWEEAAAEAREPDVVRVSFPLGRVLLVDLAPLPCLVLDPSLLPKSNALR